MNFKYRILCTYVAELRKDYTRCEYNCNSLVCDNAIGKGIEESFLYCPNCVRKNRNEISMFCRRRKALVDRLMKQKSFNDFMKRTTFANVITSSKKRSFKTPYMPL